MPWNTWHESVKCFNPFICLLNPRTLCKNLSSDWLTMTLNTGTSQSKFDLVNGLVKVNKTLQVRVVRRIVAPQLSDNKLNLSFHILWRTEQAIGLLFPVQIWARIQHHLVSGLNLYENHTRLLRTFSDLTFILRSDCSLLIRVSTQQHFPARLVSDLLLFFSFHTNSQSYG